MLIAVITFLFSVVAKSKIIKEYFGEEGAFAKQYRSTLEYTYRHGKNGNKPYKKPNYNIYDHDTYKIDGSRSHFFGHKDPYPNSP